MEPGPICDYCGNDITVDGRGHDVGCSLGQGQTGCYMDGCDRPLAHPTVDYCDYHGPHPDDDQL